MFSFHAGHGEVAQDLFARRVYHGHFIPPRERHLTVPPRVVVVVRMCDENRIRSHTSRPVISEPHSARVRIDQQFGPVWRAQQEGGVRDVFDLDSGGGSFDGRRAIGGFRRPVPAASCAGGDEKYGKGAHHTIGSDGEVESIETCPCPPKWGRS